MEPSLSGLAARVLTTRWLVRLPVPLYRHGLGWLMGSRVLMLEHRGRSSGQPRYVCLEVVERPSAHRLLVVSGFGERAQWYRNLRADPACFVSTGRTRRAPARASFLTAAESREVIGRYRERHPRDWEVLSGAIERAVEQPIGDLPIVSLDLNN